MGLRNPLGGIEVAACRGAAILQFQRLPPVQLVRSVQVQYWRGLQPDYGMVRHWCVLA